MSLLTVLLFSGLAGIAIPVGASLAYLEEERLSVDIADLHGAIIAFGGGVFLGAVVFVLLPTGMSEVSVAWAAVLFAGGTGAIMVVDHAIEVYAGDLGQMLAMVVDFVPEAIAFGALFGGGGSGGPVFAVLITLQNLPEAFSSFHELQGAGESGASAMARLAPLALMGPAAATLGFFLLGDDLRLVGALTLFAAGGILYLVFQDIAPQAFEEGDWLTTAAASIGFLVALVGHGISGG